MYQWLDIVHVHCCSEEVFNIDLYIPFWNFLFLRARHYWITNYDRVISTPILKVCICINLFCCFWQNSRNWFSILFIYLFSISRCCCISSPWCLSQCVWFSVILLYVLFSTVKDIFSLCLKTIYRCWNNLGKLKICIFVRIFTVHVVNSFSTHAN